MSWLRHAGRHVHHTVANYVEAQLEELGWMDSAETPFGAPVVSMIRSAAIVDGKLTKEVAPGTIACTLGDEFMAEEQELGGPLSLQDYPLFFDVFQDRSATSLSLATDVRDILMGRLPGCRRWLDVINQGDAMAVDDWKIELDDVERVKPETAMPHHWQVVKVTARVYFPEVQFG